LTLRQKRLSDGLELLGETRLTRRELVRRTGVGVGALMFGSLLPGCGGGADEETLKIGFVSPRTGPAAGWGEVDPYVIGLAQDALADGLEISGTTYTVEFLDRDGQSNPARGAEVAQELISSDGIDLMLVTSTPETTVPVSDACEAAGVPCISTATPWEAWYFGRGAKPDEPSPFRWTYHFCFGVADLAEAYTAMWPQVATNRKVGVMWPNDADGNAIRRSLGPLLEQAGYTIVDPGAYPNGTNDYSAQIATFKSENCEIFNTFALPPDFVTFWRQAAQQGYRPRIAQIAKPGVFPSHIEAVGDLGVNLASSLPWTRTFPYSSSLTGVSSRELADGYEKESGKQWSPELGHSLALLDVGIAALEASRDPKDKRAVADAVKTLSVQTPLGNVEWGTGPFPNVVSGPMLGGQWVKGDEHPVEFVLCDNSADPNVPVEAKLKPYA
jgi:branched-chain amino acid transport system substrate-binding protein